MCFVLQPSQFEAVVAPASEGPASCMHLSMMAWPLRVFVHELSHVRPWWPLLQKSLLLACI